jgi:hypothetical protein
MLVRLKKATQPAALDEEDFGAGPVPAAEPVTIMVNPAYVSSAFRSERNPAHTVVRMSDGRGFMIGEAFDDVVAKLGGETREQPVQ